MVIPAQARCPLPGCDAGLNILISRSGVVYEDGTADPDITSTWSVGCEDGHVVLLPPDTAADYYEWDEAASARVRDLLAAVTR
jgi:hypothetical protein